MRAMTQITFAVAGSLAVALTEFARGFTVQTGHAVEIHPGPAGLLTRAIRDGALAAEVFVSASADGPEDLHRAGFFVPPRVLARNRMVLVLGPGPAAAAGDALALLADPCRRIGISTPGADPSGDYAAAFLARLAAEDPLRWQNIGARCVSLYGDVLPDRHAPPRSPALAALAEGRAEMLIAYATTAERIARALPGARILPLPVRLAPLTKICAGLRCDSPEAARDFFEALQGDEARKLLLRHGFLAAPDQAGPPRC